MKARWKNLRDAYRKIVRKKANGRQTRWPYFKRLEFLHEVILKVPPRNYDDFSMNASEEISGEDGEGASNNSDDDPLSVTAKNLKREVGEYLIFCDY